MEDLISRQGAIELIHSLYPSAPIMRMNRERWEKKYKPYIEAEKALEMLPSAQPERKNGRWVKHDTGHSIYYDCSLCGCVAPCTEVSDSFIWKLSTYCPDCGAKMGKD